MEPEINQEASAVLSPYEYSYEDHRNEPPPFHLAGLKTEVEVSYRSQRRENDLTG